MSLAEYQGRRFDVLAFRGAVPTGEVQLAQSLFGPDSAGEVCTGVQKLAQRWLLEFLTEKGSMPFLVERGTDFMQEVRLGRLRTEADVDGAFRFAAIDVARQLGNEETDDMPDDERLAGAELLEIVVQPDVLDLRIQINSLAGTSRAVILPINIVP